MVQLERPAGNTANLTLLHFDSRQDSTRSEENPDGTRNLSHANFAYDLYEEGCIDPAAALTQDIMYLMNEAQGSKGK